MKMKTALSTILLSAGMLLSQAGLGQTKSNDVPPSAKSDTTMTQTQDRIPTFTFDNPVIMTFESYGQVGLAESFKNSQGETANVFLMAPARKDLAKLEVENYNAILLPLSFAKIPGVDSYGRSEYAAVKVAKDKQAQLTDKLLKDQVALKAFLENKGNIVEIFRNIPEYRVRTMFEQNHKENPSSPQQKGSIAFAMVGG